MGHVIAFLADAGEGIGLGHLRRCMTLGTALRERQCKIRFIVPRTAEARSLLTENGFTDSVALDFESAALMDNACAIVARAGAEFLIVDSYRVRGILPPGPTWRLGVLDDLGDRQFPVDLVINPGIGAETLRYRVLAHTRLLLGPGYALLRKEFRQTPHRVVHRRIRHILITVGGMDPHELTPRLVEWSRTFYREVEISVLVGPFFNAATRQRLERITAATPNVHLNAGGSCVRDLMLSCDLAITGGGQTAYELAATCTPAIGIMVADNQKLNLEGLDASGTLLSAGSVDDPDLQFKLNACLRRIDDVACRTALSRAGRSVVDGLGADRVAQAITEMCRDAANN